MDDSGQLWVHMITASLTLLGRMESTYYSGSLLRFDLKVHNNQTMTDLREIMLSETACHSVNDEQHALVVLYL